MKLPGRLSIALLEEDNPVKSYFRMKPLLVSEQDRIELFQDAAQYYPADGYIRIVPDNHEINIFKNRMRMIGRYCLLDLRRFSGDNEKIRSNKNYAPDYGDTNAFIVYSDVIAAPMAGLLTQVIDLAWPEDNSDFSANIPVPGTPCVALRFGGACSGPWSWRVDENSSVVFTKVEPSAWLWPQEDSPAGICLSLEDGVTMYVNLSATNVQIPVITPVQPAADPIQPAPIAAPAPKPIEQAEIPYTTHRAINARITMREQALLAQMGVSSRRGRSLYEIVDEKWRKSRLDQLGAPIPLNAAGSPVNDPIENAMTAIRAVLPIPEARTNLIQEMLRNETLNESLSAVFDAKKERLRDDGTLTELEAERLALVGEIDALKQRKETERSILLEEVRTQYAIELSRLEKKKEVLQNDIATLHATETGARAAAKTAIEELDRIIKNDIDTTLADRALESRAHDLIVGMNGEFKVSPPRPITVSPNACELISDVRSYFERAGKPLSNDEAVNLLACLALSKTIILSGPVGSGKRDLIRLTAGALGIALPEYDRFRMTFDAEAAERMVAEGRLQCDSEALSMLMLCDANSRQDIRKITPNIYSHLSKGNSLRFILSINDLPDAYPVSPSTYDRSYLIRLKYQGADTPWRPANTRPVNYGKTVSLQALESIFAPQNDLPMEMEMRMTAIRERLDKIGSPLTRRSLDALWNYCSAVLPYMQCSPMEILDLALSQRGLPTLLSTMPIEALMELPDIFKGMDRCLKLLDEPLPLPALY